MCDYKDNTEESIKRVDAFWNREVIDRVPIQAVVRPEELRNPPKEDGKKLSNQELEQYWTDPDLVIPRLQGYMKKTYYGGEAFPVMYPVSINMVAITANYLGAPMKFVNRYTTWHEAIIDDPDNLPSFEFDPENRWWKISKRLLEEAVARTDGYHVGCPDLNGPTEALALLRYHEKLAVDFYDNPGYIKPSIDKITKTWFKYWQEITKITQKTGGYFYWMGIYSDDVPSIDLQSDFSCMISKELFDQHFLPSIEEQTRLVDRTMYHLDGPGAIKHCDSLMALPGLNGIQWVQGAGGGSVLEYLDLLKKIQAGGKLLFCYCEKHELEQLLSELQPEGLFVVIQDLESREEADLLLKKAEQWTKSR